MGLELEVSSPLTTSQFSIWPLTGSATSEASQPGQQKRVTRYIKQTAFPCKQKLLLTYKSLSEAVISPVSRRAVSVVPLTGHARHSRLNGGRRRLVVNQATRAGYCTRRASAGECHIVFCPAALHPLLAIAAPVHGKGCQMPNASLLSGLQTQMPLGSSSQTCTTQREYRLQADRLAPHKRRIQPKHH